MSLLVCLLFVRTPINYYQLHKLITYPCLIYLAFSLETPALGALCSSVRIVRHRPSNPRHRPSIATWQLQGPLTFFSVVLDRSLQPVSLSLDSRSSPLFPTTSFCAASLTFTSEVATPSRTRPPASIGKTLAIQSTNNHNSAVSTVYYSACISPAVTDPQFWPGIDLPTYNQILLWTSSSHHLAESILKS